MNKQYWKVIFISESVTNLISDSNFDLTGAEIKPQRAFLNILNIPSDS